MLIYPLPPRLPDNPYLDLLYASMCAPDLVVRRERPRRSLPQLLFTRGPRLLHLHFFDELTQRVGRPAAAVRSLAFLSGLAALRARGVRLIWTAHNLAPHEVYHPTLAFLVYRCVIRWSYAVIAHGPAALALLEQRYGSLPRPAAIPHGNYVGVYGPMRGQAASRSLLGLPASGRVLLNIGALRPYKGLEELIEAFSHLPPTSRGTLLIAGAARDPIYTSALQSYAARVPGVRFEPRRVADDMLPAYLGAADAVALPYRRLLTSGMLVLALSYARPVIVPDVGPARELVREGREGFLFAPGDTGALTAALVRALAHPDLRELGKTALERVRAPDWGEIAGQTAAVYRSVFAH